LQAGLFLVSQAVSGLVARGPDIERKMNGSRVSAPQNRHLISDPERES
jgi:hypothetical protein